MLTKERYMDIKQKHDRGVYIKDIAEEKGASAKTVSRALKRGGAPSGKRPGARTSAGSSMSFMVLAPNIFSPIPMNSVTDSTGAVTEPISSAGS